MKNPLPVQKIQDQSLGWDDPLEKEMATHCSILAWRIRWTEEPGGLQSMGLQRVRLNNNIPEKGRIKESKWFRERSSEVLVSAGLRADPVGNTGPPPHLRVGLTLRQGFWLSVPLGHSGHSKAQGMEPRWRGNFHSVAANSPAMRVAVSH